MSGWLAGFLTALLGGSLQELVHWYERRGSLRHVQFTRLRNSTGYWIITALMIVGSALGSVVWFAGEDVSLRGYLLAGAAFPLLLKKAVSAFISNAPSTLGNKDREEVPTIELYFR